MQLNAPGCVKVELTEGCSRRCAWCGIQLTRSKPMQDLRFIEPDFAAEIAAQVEHLAPHCRIEFTLHGEPLLNPDALKIFRQFRAILPRTQMQVTTNGYTLVGRMSTGLQELFAAGIDIVVLDTYRPERDVLRAAAFALKGQVPFRVEDFFDDWVPSKKTPYANFHRKETNVVVLMDDLLLRDGESKIRAMHNQAGNNPLLPVPPTPLQRTCTRPFRELVVCHDGDVLLCCNDYGHELVVGNAKQQPLKTIWQGPVMEAARCMLQNKLRTFTPCARCSCAAGVRVGLLPRYPNPTAEQLRLLKEAVMSAKPRNKQNPYTLF